MLDCQCVLFLVDVTNKQSLDKIEKLFKAIDFNDYPFLKIILVENKIDENREIDDDNIDKFMEQNEIEKKFQISIKNGNGIEELVDEIKNCVNYLEKNNPINFCSQLFNEDDNNIKKEKNYYKGMINIIFLGNSMVGKSTLYIRLSDNIFRPNFLSSIGVDKLSKSFKYNNNIYKVNLFDTAGQDKYRSSLPAKYYRNADGIFLLFDISNKNSFNDISIWMNEIKTKHDNLDEDKKEPVIFLIGNKLDISDRQISYDEAEDKASFYGIKYFEISCKLNINIPEIYSRMVTECIPKLSSLRRIKPFQVSPPDNKKNKKGCC